MIQADLATQPCVQLLRIRLPKKCKFLMEMHRFKVLHGGRGGGKSWAVADALLALGAAQELRILCAREVQESIKQSVHKLLSDRIQALGLGDFYQILDTEIRGRNGTTFTFTGLGAHTVTSIKSYEGVDICWVEEAQTVPDRSWTILIPTIRAKNSEIWATFNPDMDTDAVWQRFIVNPPTDEAPFDCVVREINWSDNKHFPEVLNRERQHCKKAMPDDYDNIWEGKCRTSIAGAIYARELREMELTQRIRLIPYDPRYQVHCIWDLGWNDAMTIVMVQKPNPTAAFVINYFEDSFQRYDEIVRDLRALNYNWGYDWLPHDSGNTNPITGTNAYSTLRKLGRKVRPPMQRTDPEARIKAARMMFPRIYIDSSDYSKRRETGWLGGARLIECLRHYRRVLPQITRSNPEPEPAAPKHDQYSHGCFVAGTLITTARGAVPIEQVLVGDQVWTPAGYSRVLAAGVVKLTDDLVRVEAGGVALVCTPEHKLLTHKGFVRADALGYDSRLFNGEEWPCVLIGLYSKAGNTGFRATITGEMSGAPTAHRTFTGQSGKTRTGRYRMATTSITSMATRSTTSWRTSNAWIVPSIFASIPSSFSGLVFSSPLANSRFARLLSGTLVPKGWNGTDLTARILGLAGHGLRAFASSVAKNIARLILRAPCSATVVAKARPERPSGGKIQVYDLTVEKNSCYLANGILVSNCDAFGAMAEVIDQIVDDVRNENAPLLPAYVSTDPGVM